MTSPRSFQEVLGAFKHLPIILSASPFRGRRIDSFFLRKNTGCSARYHTGFHRRINVGFTRPIALNSDRPTAFFGVEAEVGKSTPRMAPNGQQIANFGALTEGPAPRAAVHASHPMMNQASELRFVRATRYQPRGDVEGARRSSRFRPTRQFHAAHGPVKHLQPDGTG